MSDLGDLNLPSYPTFPATLTSEESPFPSAHDLPHPPPLVPTPGNNMASSLASSTPNSMRTMTNSPAAGNGDGNIHHLKLSTPQNENIVPSTSSYSPLASVGGLHGLGTPSSISSQAAGSELSPLGQMGTSFNPGTLPPLSDASFAAGGTLSSLGASVRPELIMQSTRPQELEPWKLPLLTSEALISPQSTSESKDSVGLVGGVGASMQMRELELRCAKLTKERANMEEMFGRQRKTFMNQMSHTEKQLNMCKSRIDAYEKEVRALKLETEEKEKQLTESAVRAASIREDFDVDRVKYEEEIASLKAIVTVQSQDTDRAVQQERTHWLAERKKLMTELEEMRRAVVQPVRGVAQPIRGVIQPSSGGLSSSPPDRVTKSPSPGSEDENLELSMIKAKEDANILRSVVLPMEKEIKSLREHLQTSESKVEELEGVVKELRELEEANSSRTAPLIDLDSSLSLPDTSSSIDFNSPMPTDSKELQHQLKLARSACSDLEMHTSQMNLQKHIMQDEIRTLHAQLKQAKSRCSEEKNKVDEMKRTWELANDHFIVSQDKLKQEIYRLQQKLERGDSASPLRDINIENLPAPNLENLSLEDKEKNSSRRHQRSMSSEEASEALLDTIAAQQQNATKSASWNSLYKPPNVSADVSSQIQDLEEALKKSQEEVQQQTGHVRNLEQQLARVQSQMSDDVREKEEVIDKLKVENTKLQASVMRQKQQHESLRRLMDDLKDEMRTKIETFQTNEKEFKAQMRILKDKFVELKQDSQREIAKMSEARRENFILLKTSREEYDCLKRVQKEDMVKYQAEIASLKQSLGEVTASFEAATQQYLHTKEQLTHVREMMLAERNNKEKISANLEEAEKKISALTPLEEMIVAEKKAKEDAVAAKTTVEKKARDFVNEQKNTIETLTKEKTEAQIQDFLRQVASLKHKLNHTEETQKDFVKLSQSLQMQLALIEEEKEQQRSELQESLSST